MSEHTPGPWDCESNPDTATWYVYGPGHAICTTFENEPRDVANARLIAAAPDMYDALRTALSEISEYADESGTGAEWPEDEHLRAIVTIAESALAKVEGV